MRHLQLTTYAAFVYSASFVQQRFPVSRRNQCYINQFIIIVIM